MIPYRLKYNYTDIFLAPRLALSGKKIFLIIKGNIFGYAAYFLLSSIALLSTGMSTTDIILKYGLYPCLFGHQAEWYSWVIYFSGMTIWYFSALLCHSGVSRIFLKQLKGNNFFSGKDALKFVFKHWRAIIFTPLTILLIIISFLLFSLLFATLSKIPIVGQISFPILYIFYFLGSCFTIISVFVLFNSLLQTPSIVSIYEEDTMGSVFQAYSITFSQTRRIIFYNILLLLLLIISVEIFSWFCLNSIGLISVIFGHESFMGNQFLQINNYSLSIILPENVLDFLLSYKNLIFNKISLGSGIPIVFKTTMNFDLVKDLSVIDNISSVILSAVYFLIGLSIFSYGISILTVGQSLIFIIFKKISDEDDIIMRSDKDDDLEDLMLQKNFEANYGNFSNDFSTEEE